MARIYKAQEHTIIVCGVPIPGGWADGDVFTFEPDGEGFTATKGTDGDVVWSDNGQNLWILTLNLMQGSEANAALQAIYNEQKRQANGLLLPSLIRNRIGTFSAASAQSLITTPAGYTASRAVGSRSWIVQMDKPLVVGA